MEAVQTKHGLCSTVLVWLFQTLLLEIILGFDISTFQVLKALNIYSLGNAYKNAVRQADGISHTTVCICCVSRRRLAVRSIRTSWASHAKIWFLGIP